MVNGTQFGATQGTVSPSGIYTFSGTPFTIPAGGTVNVNVYADTLSTASGTTSGGATLLTGLSGTGSVSYDAVSLPASVQGQDLSFAGAASVALATGAGQPDAGIITMGSTGNVLLVVRFLETSDAENVKVTQVTVTDTVTPNAKAAFSNLSLWNGSTLLGSSNAPVQVSPTTYTYMFNIAGYPLVVPQGGSVLMTIRGDTATYTSQGATDNTTHTFSVASSNVTALGATSYKAAAVTGAASANPQTVIRSTAAVTGASLSQSGGKSGLQQIGSITITANTAGAIQPGKITVTFSGNGYTYGSSTFLNTVQLRDASLNSVTGSDGATVTSNVAAGTVTWTFPTITPLAVNAGGNTTLQLWAQTNVIPSGCDNGSGGVSQSLSATVQNAGDFQYYDGADSNAYAIGLISLPSTQGPIPVSSLGWGQCQ